MKLWAEETEERLEYFPASERKSDLCALIFPGGAYAFLAEHEGKGYAEYFNAIGMDAYVCSYRVYPDRFPLPLLDARRALTLVREDRKKRFGGGKVIVVGSSAGGNLAALLCTCNMRFEGEKELPEAPDGQVLCYPVISFDDGVTHEYSRQCLLGEDRDLAEALSPEKHVTKNAPPAFIWHTADDGGVPVRNSLLYTASLHDAGVPVETHVFPHGAHGLGLAQDSESVGQWTVLLRTWLRALENGEL